MGFINQLKTGGHRLVWINYFRIFFDVVIRNYAVSFPWSLRVQTLQTLPWTNQRYKMIHSWMEFVWVHVWNIFLVNTNYESTLKSQRNNKLYVTLYITNPCAPCMEYIWKPQKPIDSHFPTRELLFPLWKKWPDGPCHVVTVAAVAPCSTKRTSKSFVSSSWTPFWSCLLDFIGIVFG